LICLLYCIARRAERDEYDSEHEPPATSGSLGASLVSMTTHRTKLLTKINYYHDTKDALFLTKGGYWKAAQVPR